MDRYDTYTDKLLHDTQYNILGTNLAEVGTDTISRQEAIMDAESWVPADEYEKNLKKKVVEWLKEFPPAQPEQHIDADGTLWITVTDIEQVTRVIVDENKSKFCKQFYMDAQNEQRTDLLKAEIKRMKRSFTICINSEYYTGYMSALSAVEGYIAMMEGDANES